MEHTPSPDTLGERKHRFVQSEINETALRLFIEKGFDQTTVDEIAAAAGISRRTYFRYFETKEDVIITALAKSGTFLMELIHRQPAGTDALTLMRRSLREFVSHYQQTDPQAWKVLNLIQCTPKLRARFLHERDRWLPQIAGILTERSIPPGQAEVAASTALGILTVVYRRWHADSSVDVGTVVDEAFGEFEELAGQASDGT